MAEFTADVRDIKFVLFDQLNLAPIFSHENYRDFSSDDLSMIVDEAYRFAREVLAPANGPGDRTGCAFDDGKVSVPSVFREPYKVFCEAGWININQPREYGGQGGPDLFRTAVDDLFFGACCSFSLGILLTPAAARLIQNFGTESQRNTYIRKMVSGIWSGTMCLTEPQAGSDVGAATTKATPHGDHYLIQGRKIFITLGEHDLAENIVHCVLARIDGAPSGTQGLSLFVVPKYRVNADGTVGEFNDVECAGIEHKMGIHGSPTCVMNFGSNGKCHGWLLGEPNQGMRVMFHMMNEARIGVGLQGTAIGNAAYQAALAYAKERLQGSDFRQFKDPKAPRVPIIRHPDVQRNLMRQKAYAEGCRALTLYATYCGDMSRCAAEPADRDRYHSLLEILTPIAKAYCTDMGFRVTEWALQTMGGAGYLKDYPVEQYLRDCKIASVYEGTNGIQALDLVGRKLGAKGGANLMALLDLMQRLIKTNKEHPAFKKEVAAFADAIAIWGKVNSYFMQCSMGDKRTVPVFNATNYLGMCGELVLSYLLLDQGIVAHKKLVELCQKHKVNADDAVAVRELALRDEEARYLDGKIKTARFFVAHELPEVNARATSIQSGDLSAMDVVWETV